MPFVVALVGPCASDKRTLGRLVASLTGAVLIDNHLIHEPIFATYGDQHPPLEVCALTDRIRDAVAHAVRIAPRHQDHVFTNYLTPDDGTELGILRGLAEHRSARFLPVWLHCGRSVRKPRVSTTAHRGGCTLEDPAHRAHLWDEDGPLAAPADALILDSAHASAMSNARHIVDVLR